jgi:hypothetical protein
MREGQSHSDPYAHHMGRAPLRLEEPATEELNLATCGAPDGAPQWDTDRAPKRCQHQRRPQSREPPTAEARDNGRDKAVPFSPCLGRRRHETRDLPSTFLGGRRHGGEPLARTPSPASRAFGGQPAKAGRKPGSEITILVPGLGLRGE